MNLISENFVHFDSSFKNLKDSNTFRSKKSLAKAPINRGAVGCAKLLKYETNLNRKFVPIK